MPKRSPAANVQPRLPGEPLTPRPASDLFIVDNGNTDWQVARYLRDWCELARAFDIATGTGAFLKYVVEQIYVTYQEKHKRLSAAERRRPARGARHPVPVRGAALRSGWHFLPV